MCRGTYTTIERGTMEHGRLEGWGTIWVGPKEDLSVLLLDTSKGGRECCVSLGENEYRPTDAYMSIKQLAQLIGDALTKLPKEVVDQILDQHADALMKAECRAFESNFPADFI